jgi:DNA polymerase-3 subunit gamma/tau
MLSKAAGNALLKTLEEPPEHVHFVLATTEPYKLLDTIRSRSQRFDFHPVPIEDLAAHLSVIADREGYKVDPPALIAIARHAAGSVRDSLSLLEQVAALGAGSVDVAGVRRALGLADSEAFMRLVEAVAGQDAKAALELVAELAADGVDLRRFVAESVGFFRGAFLAHYAPNLAEISDEPADVYEAWRKAAQVIPAGDVLRAVDLLGEALVRLREGREERLMTELALIKLTRPETASDGDALLARVERMERRLGRPDQAPVPSESATPMPATDGGSAPVPVIEASPAAEPAPPAAAVISLEQLQKVWPGLFGSLRDVLGARRWAFFREAVPAAVEGDVIVLEVAHDFHLQSLQEDGAVAAIVATRAGDLLGSPVRVRFGLRAGEDGGGEETIDIDQLEERPNGSADPTTLLAAELGAEVVDE